MLFIIGKRPMTVLELRRGRVQAQREIVEEKRRKSRPIRLGRRRLEKTRTQKLLVHSLFVNLLTHIHSVPYLFTVLRYAHPYSQAFGYNTKSSKPSRPSSLISLGAYPGRTQQDFRRTPV